MDIMKMMKQAQTLKKKLKDNIKVRYKSCKNFIITPRFAQAFFHIFQIAPSVCGIYLTNSAFSRPAQRRKAGFAVIPAHIGR